MSLIDNLISMYNSKKDTYNKVKDDVKRILEFELNNAGIMAIVSTRIKDSERLKDKLINRKSDKKNYNSFEDVENDIVDLVGARIALYFPSDSKKVDSIIQSVFLVEKTKTFPSEQGVYTGYDRRFSGYSAKHYRVFLKPQQGTSENLNVRIEIQVASLLMHAWSEVEHDLAYKKKQGEISFEEYESLDEINGLVIAGELSLQRLQRITETRLVKDNKPFENHFQLATFLYDELKLTYKTDANIGDVDVLYKFLSNINRMTPKKIKNDLAQVNIELDTPITQQVIDKYISVDSKNTSFVFNEINNKNEKSIKSNLNVSSMESFINNWISLEKQVRNFVMEYNVGAYLNYKKDDSYTHIYDGERISLSLLDRYIELRKIRNRLIHGDEIPNIESLNKYISEIKSLKSEIDSYGVRNKKTL